MLYAEVVIATHTIIFWTRQLLCYLRKVTLSPFISFYWQRSKNAEKNKKYGCFIKKVVLSALSIDLIYAIKIHRINIITNLISSTSQSFKSTEDFLFPE
jgi:hypothetical protein